jgi:RNA polymerase sigma-70 factor, ECF subfamily
LVFLSDEQLVSKCQTGFRKRHYASVLCERHSAYVTKFVLRRVNDIEVAKDIAQETFVNAFNSLMKPPNKEGSFRGDCPFKSWLLGIAYNQCNDHWRKSARRHQKSHVTIDDFDGEVSPIQISSEQGNPEEKLIEEERKAAVRAAVAQLSELDKTTIELHLDGFRYEEIAEITQSNVNRVGSRIFYAKKKIRNYLDKEGLI